MPSNLPPVGWLSMWLPVITGGSDSSRPARRAKMLPILSMPTLQPASSHQRTKRSRAALSTSVSASRQTPPFSVAPIFAISIRLAHRRSPSTLMFRTVTLRRSHHPGERPIIERGTDRGSAASPAGGPSAFRGRVGPASLGDRP